MLEWVPILIWAMVLHPGQKNQMEILPECVYSSLWAWKDVNYVRNVRNIISIYKICIFKYTQVD